MTTLPTTTTDLTATSRHLQTLDLLEPLVDPPPPLPWQRILKQGRGKDESRNMEISVRFKITATWTTCSLVNSITDTCISMSITATRKPAKIWVQKPIWRYPEKTQQWLQWLHKDKDPPPSDSPQEDLPWDSDQRIHLLETRSTGFQTPEKPMMKIPGDGLSEADVTPSTQSEKFLPPLPLLSEKPERSKCHWDHTHQAETTSLHLADSSTDGHLFPWVWTRLPKPPDSCPGLHQCLPSFTHPPKNLEDQYDRSGPKLPSWQPRPPTTPKSKWLPSHFQTSWKGYCSTSKFSSYMTFFEPAW